MGWIIYYAFSMMDNFFFKIVEEIKFLSSG